MIAPSCTNIAQTLARQLNTMVPWGGEVSANELGPVVCAAMERVDTCFQGINHPLYFEANVAMFDPLHTDQLCTAIYFMSNVAHQQSPHGSIAKKLFGLNKALSGFVCMYDTELPPVFYLIHSVGTVLGKAKFGNYMVFCGNSTVGAIRGEFPTFGDRVIFSAGASVIGPCHIGRNVSIGPGCAIIKTDVPDDTMILASTEYITKPNSNRPFANYFREPLL